LPEAANAKRGWNASIAAPAVAPRMKLRRLNRPRCHWPQQAHDEE